MCHRSTAIISFADLQCKLLTYLVEKHVLSVTTFCGEIFEISILTDSMLLTKLRPELGSNYASVNKNRVRPGACDILLLPHWPAWIVMISLTSIQSQSSFFSTVSYLGIVARDDHIDLRQRSVSARREAHWRH